MRQRSVLATCIIASALLLGCGNDVIDEIDAIELAQDLEDREFFLEIGIGTGDGFRAFNDGDICDIAFFTQGGYFAMLSVRGNVPAQSLVSCGLVVGDTATEQRVLMYEGEHQAVGGWIVPFFPGEPDRVCEVDGLIGTFYCEFDNGTLVEVDMPLDVNYVEPSLGPDDLGPRPFERSCASRVESPD